VDRASGSQLGATESARSQAEREPALSPDDVLDVLDRLADGIVVLDRDLRCRFVSASVGEVLGSAPDALIGEHIWTARPAYAGSPFHLACEEAARTGLPGRLVAHHARLDRWFESRILPQEQRVVVLFRDVSDEQRAHEELRHHAERLDEAQRIVRFGIWEWEVASGRVTWSDELHHIYGLRPGDFGGTVDAFMEHLHPADRERVWANIEHSMRTLEPFVFEERIVRPDGEERVLLSQGRAMAGPDGAVAVLVGVCHDVTDRARIERALGASERRMHAIVDNTPSLISVKDLSGRYLMCNAEASRVVGMEAGEMVGKLCVDVFPPDVAAAQRVIDRRAASEGEPVYGETVLMRDTEPRSYLTVTFMLPDEDGLPAETCTIATDVTERNERESERRERVAWAKRIGSALDEGRMAVFAQPILDLGSGAVVAHELLVRMRTAGENPVVLDPDGFLPAAERFGLIQSIDTWMVTQALELAADMAPQVNVSALTMCDPAARREIVALLEAAPGAARRIVFEITETAAAQHLDAAQAFARDVTRLGCRLALDDFGTGFGSFTYLRSLPLNHIKIDVEFVRHLVDSRDDRRVVQSIIGIAEQFGLSTIAEGVEDQATLELLRGMGADSAQGFHIGRPAPVHRGAPLVQSTI
jgi:PAS domain S-box-containing protein